MPAESFPSLNAPTWPRRLVRVALWLIGIGVLLVVVAGPLSRFGILGFQPALLLLAGGALLLGLGTLIAIVGLLFGVAKGSAVPRGVAALGIVVGLGVIFYLLSWLRAATGVPPIHEISTDLSSPPPFVAIREIRARTPGLNPPEYVAEQSVRGKPMSVPEMQRESYPDLQPMILQTTPDVAFQRVEAAARAMGWEIVAAVPAEGRLEATDTTRFFGFKDDVVVRLRFEGGATRVDVRSKSRVGLGDAGANAIRVRAFLEKLRAS